MTLLFNATILMFSASTLLISATTLLFSASILLISATLLFNGSTLLYCIILYLRVPTVLCTYYSFLLVYACKHLYEKHMNKDQYAYENKNLRCISILLYRTVVYPRVPSVPNCMICTPTREMNMMTHKRYIHVYIYI